MADGFVHGQEDCLYLNVYTPQVKIVQHFFSPQVVLIFKFKLNPALFNFKFIAEDGRQRSSSSPGDGVDSWRGFLHGKRQR
jgi:hypothetical protein